MKNKSIKNLDLDLIKDKLRKFAKDRDWEQYHSPKNISMALSVEVAELLEIFQWSNDGGYKEIEDAMIKEQIEDEIADIFNYLIRLIDILDIDLENASLKKMKKNEIKYPIEKSKGSSLKYDKL